MQHKFIIFAFTLIFIFGSALDAEAQKKRKKKGKERPAKTENVDEEESSSSRSRDETKSQIGFMDKERLAYDLLGNLGFSGGLYIGLKPAVSYKVLDKVHFGVAPKFNYYFFNQVGADDINYIDYGVSFFGRFMALEMLYLQLGYDFNNVEALVVQREWINGMMLGGGYTSGFGKWKYGVQALFELSNEVRDYDNFPIELWIGFYYNL